MVLASGVLGFTLVKNTNYALAESSATSAGASLDKGRLEMATQSNDSAIALAPDVGRYRVARANILDQVRDSTAAASAQARLALAAYQANGRAVNTNPFDTYSILHFAESALTLAALKQPGKGQEAIEEYRRLASMLPRFWLPHFLLGRTYVGVGEPDHAVEAYSEAIEINPQPAMFYDRRTEAHGMLGEYGFAADDYGRAIQLGLGGPSVFNRRGVALFAQGRSEEAIRDFDPELKALYQLPSILEALGLTRFDEPIKEDRMIESLYDKLPAIREAIRIKPALPLAYNNRGSACYQLGRIERAIEDYDRAIQLSAQTANFYANRAYAYELLTKNSEAQRDFERTIELGFDFDSLGRD